MFSATYEKLDHPYKRGTELITLADGTQLLTNVSGDTWHFSDTLHAVGVACGAIGGKWTILPDGRSAMYMGVYPSDVNAIEGMLLTN